MASNTAEKIEVDGPAIVTPMHIKTRQLSDKEGKVIIGKTGHSVETVFQRVCRLNQLVCREMCTDDKARDLEIERALDRRDVGKAYSDAWDKSTPGSKDSTDLSRGGSPENADGMTIVRLDAAKLLAGWRAHMAPNDWMICRRVCGENFSVAQAVIEISPSYRDATLARFREALDALIFGSAEARKCEWCRRGRPHGSRLEN